MSVGCQLRGASLRIRYDQVGMDGRDANKAAFVTRSDISAAWKVMTFGRLMYVVLLGLNIDICPVYLNDVIIFCGS